jgi:predicted PurR-regulated permease PerM
MSKNIKNQVSLTLYMVLLILLSLFIISPFIVPILFASTIALALFPIQLKLESRNWKNTRAAGLIVSIFTLVVTMPFMFFLTKGTMLIIDLLEKFAFGVKLENKGTKEVFAVIKHDIVGKILEYVSQFPMANFITEEKIYSYMKTANVVLLDFFKNLTGGIPAGVLFFVVMMLSTFAFLSGAKKVRKFFDSMFGFTSAKTDQIVGIFLRNSRQVYISNLVTGFIQSIIVATGVYFVSGADWFLVFFITLIFSFIPVVGAAPMAFLFALIAFVQGERSDAVILLIIGGVTGITDNILRPWLASQGESKTPATISFIFVIGGALLFGFPGLFIGLFVGAIAYDTLPIFWEAFGGSENGKGLIGFLHLDKPDKD